MAEITQNKQIKIEIIRREKKEFVKALKAVKQLVKNNNTN